MATFTRQQFYAAVWSKSALQLAKEIGVSDVAISKACKRHDIPKPPLGYWAKVQHGQKPTRPKLPDLDDPRRQTINLEPVPEHLRSEALSEETKGLVLREKADENRIVVPTLLDIKHPLVERTMKSLLSSAPNGDGIVVPRAKGCLDIAIGKDSIQRAMRIIDALIVAMTARGMKVTNDGAHKWGTLVRLDGEVIGLRMSESLGERPRQLTPAQRHENAKYVHYKPHAETEKHPRGLLTLTAAGEDDPYIQRRWSELDGKPLEERLNKVVVWFYKAAEQLKARQIEFAEREVRWAEERRLREDVERRRWENERKLKQFEEDAAAWRRARHIREYADALERAAVATGDVLVPESELAKQLRWAREQADRFDPLVVLRAKENPA